MIPATATPRRRTARATSGRALFATLAGTIRLLRWLLASLVAVYLCSGITRVGPHEDAVIYRLGRLQPTLHAPGLCFALPAPIDRVIKLPTRTQQELALNAWTPDDAAIADATTSIATSSASTAPQLPAALLAVLPANNPAVLAQPAPTAKGLHPVFDGYTLTGDANLVHARFTVRYRIADPLRLLRAASASELPRLLEAAVYHAATVTLASAKIDTVLGAGLERLREQIRVTAQQRCDALQLGLELVAVEINALTPPAATAAAFADVTSAQVEARTTLEQARTYRAQTAPQAASDAFRTRQQASADATELVMRARGEAASFLALVAQHRTAPALVETRLRAETVDHVFSRVKTRTFLPADTGQLNLLLRDAK